MRASAVLQATWQRTRRPRTWGAALLFGLVWNGTRLLMGLPSPGLLEALTPSLWVALFLVLAPLPWQWTGDEAPLASAPRGAAQAVYRNEVRRQIDPALVEQIGPRQYRLRIFPIDPQQIEYEPNSLRGTIQEGEPLYMWLTYRTLAVEGAWPLPQMSEKLNVFWDDATVRLLNGQPLALGAAADETWLPASPACRTRCAWPWCSIARAAWPISRPRSRPRSSACKRFSAQALRLMST